MKSLLIVAHGSRRAASNDEVRALSERVARQAGDAYRRVECAFLELAEPSIPDGIQAEIDAGAVDITVVPYFLSAGRHVAEDIPAEVAKVSLPEGVNVPHDLQIDPAEPDRMYLCAWPWTKLGKEYCGGMYRTEDGGRSWTAVFNPQAHVWGIAIDPRKPSTVCSKPSPR